MEDQEVTTTTHIVKGKRTKRQRVQSPIPFGLTTNSSSSGDGVADDYDNIGKNSINWSPTTSNNNNDDEFQDSTEEEEDMANCLILLAKGHSIRDNYSPRQELDDHHRRRENYTGGVYTANKFNSRKFLETASTGAGKVGYYVYECKTCNRTFPSFQALGGHRASHKKLKSIHNDEKKQHFTLSSDEEDRTYYRNVSSLSLQLSDSNYNTTNNRGTNTNHPSNNKAKIHECSICGAEFTSGQALGGHMRRHRGLVMPSNTTILSLTPTAAAMESEEAKEARNVLSLDLDLNLPAPEDDNKFSFASKQPQKQPQPKQQQQQQQQTPIVFSSPALVDCHY